jgi:CRISPR system Cascade subunit CasA
MSETFSFDLVDEPWRPWVERSNRRPVCLGLRDTLVRAPELRELVDPSPLATAALHRLLLALLHRIVGPPGTDAWLALWRAGRWEPVLINAYPDRWQRRFDLLEPEHPFYQTTGMGRGVRLANEKMLHSIQRLGTRVAPIVRNAHAHRAGLVRRQL